MKKLIIFLVLALLGLLVWLFIPGTLKEPEFVTVKDLELLETGDLSAEFRAVAVFNNPNNVPATLLNTELKVYSNDVAIGGVSQTNISEIPPLTKFEVPFSFRVDMLKLGYSQGLSSLLEKLLNENREVPVRVEGYCRIRSRDNVYRIPILYEGKLHFK